MPRPGFAGCLFLLLCLIQPPRALAQEPAAVTIDPVAAALAADAPDGCDDIGRTILFQDLDDPGFPLERGMACHRGAGAILMAACTAPLTDTALLKGQLRLATGEAFVLCHVAVGAAGERAVVVSPEQFSLVTGADIVYAPLQGFRGSELPPLPASQRKPVTGGPWPDEPDAAPADVPPGASIPSLDIRIFRAATIDPDPSRPGTANASGTLVFEVRTPLAVPFLLLWKPKTENGAGPAAVVNDRFLDPAEIP